MFCLVFSGLPTIGTIVDLTNKCGIKKRVMKNLIYLLACVIALGFTSKKMEDDINGIWMGYYRSDLIKEKVIVKFDNERKLEFYTGGVDDRTRSLGTYVMQGDSVIFTYTSKEGQQFIMKGLMNRGKNYLDGSWQTNDQSNGSFFLERQNVEEKFVNP